MKNLEKIYLSLPVIIQQQIVALYGCAWYERRFSKHFHRYVANFKSREYFNKEQFTLYQQEKLSEILTEAWKSPYYSKVFSESNITPNDSNLDILKKIPLLSKETVRIKYRDLLTTKKIPQSTIVQKSSGTTGTPTNIYYTKEFHAFELATSEARNLNWAGVNYKDRRVMFGVRKVCAFQQDKPPFWRFSPRENMAYASIYHLSPRFLHNYMDFLRSYKPAIIMGYPSALYTIANYAIENKDYPFPARAIVTMAETLELRVRQALEKTWNCRVFDRYGAVEGCMFVSQCEYGKYHVSPDVGIIEILGRDGKACPPGVIGEVVCTGLHNKLQPLIRYKVGDVACWSLDQDCLCKRQMPIIERIEGRFEDICYTPDGREILRFDTVFKGLDTIKEAQVVQESMDLFTIYVVPTKDFSLTDIERLKENMKLHVGNIQTNIELVSEIERTSSGKFKAVVSKINKRSLNQFRN